MAWKWPWQKSDSGVTRMADSAVLLLEHLEDLRSQIAVERTQLQERDAQIRMALDLNDQLIKVVAERDAQIRMVLEERFYRPVIKPVEQPAPPFVAEELNDVTQFDGESDEGWLKREAEILERMKNGRRPAHVSKNG